MDAMDTLYVEVSITNLPSVRYNRVVTQTYLDLVGNLSSNHFEKIVNEKKNICHLPFFLFFSFSRWRYWIICGCVSFELYRNCLCIMSQEIID